MSEQSEVAASNPVPAEVVVSRILACPAKRVWKELMTKQGAEALLGPGAEFGEKGHTWTSEDGLAGVTRTLHPIEEIRFSIRQDDKPPSMVQIDLLPEGDTTTLKVTHSNLNEDTDRPWLVGRWEAALGRIDAYLAE
ncbi:MAG: SRPBCC domain-containing protein [Propionibacteriaceae bacterium]|nr:SRPBCC domain-containing protein [Propionibacteriaceae bacterium]